VLRLSRSESYRESAGAKTLDHVQCSDTHVRQELPSHSSVFALQSPIFPGEYSQLCPAFVHTLAGAWRDPSLGFERGQPAETRTITIAAARVTGAPQCSLAWCAAMTLATQQVSFLPTGM
jgi:hypothetical protein